MKKRIMLDAFVETQEQADEIISLLKKMKFVSIDGEDSVVRVHDCHHDESPPKPCTNSVSFILSSKKKSVSL